MNIWLYAAAGMLAALVPCGIASFRGNAEDRLAGIEMAGSIVPLQMILIAEAFHRPAFYDLAISLTILSFGGGLVFARFLQRWL